MYSNHDISNCNVPQSLHNILTSDLKRSVYVPRLGTTQQLQLSIRSNDDVSPGADPHVPTQKVVRHVFQRQLEFQIGRMPWPKSVTSPVCCPSDGVNGGQCGAWRCRRQSLADDVLGDDRR